MDASTYKMGKDGFMVKCTFIDQGDSIYRAFDDRDELGLYIKVYSQIAASGIAANLVLHFADPNLQEHERWSAKINGLSHDCSPEGFVWIVCTATRAGNDEFYEWLINNSIIPFVDRLKVVAGAGDNPHFLYSMDGELTQIRNFLTESALDQFAERGVDLLKHSASTSENSNANDQDVFLGTKTKNKHASDEADILHGMAAHQRVIDELLTKHCPSMTNRSLIADRLIRTVWLFQTVLTRNVIVHSFMKTGQLIDRTALHKDFLDSKLAMYPNLISKNQYDIIRAAFGPLREEMRRTGTVTEKTMDDLNIPKINSTYDRRKAPKDQRALSYRRAVILNHQHTVDRWNADQKAKTEAPLLRQEKNELLQREKEARAQAEADSKAAKVQKKKQKKLIAVLRPLFKTWRQYSKQSKLKKQKTEKEELKKRKNEQNKTQKTQKKQKTQQETVPARERTASASVLDPLNDDDAFGFMDCALGKRKRKQNSKYNH